MAVNRDKYLCPKKVSQVSEEGGGRRKKEGGRRKKEEKRYISKR
jgi:hypothetical protein